MATETTNTQPREFDTLQEAFNAAAEAAMTSFGRPVSGILYSEAWQGVAGLLAKGGFIVCRVGGKKQSLDALTRGMVVTVLSAFPSAELDVHFVSPAPVPSWERRAPARLQKPR